MVKIILLEFSMVMTEETIFKDTNFQVIFCTLIISCEAAFHSDLSFCLALYLQPLPRPPKLPTRQQPLPHLVLPLPPAPAHAQQYDPPPQVSSIKVSMTMDQYYTWTLIHALMNSCTCHCQKCHKSILNMLSHFDRMIVTAS